MGDFRRQQVAPDAGMRAHILICSGRDISIPGGRTQMTTRSKRARFRCRRDGPVDVTGQMLDRMLGAEGGDAHADHGQAGR
jgi:hypothetical protein